MNVVMELLSIDKNLSKRDKRQFIEHAYFFPYFQKWFLSCFDITFKQDLFDSGFVFNLFCLSLERISNSWI